MGEYYYSRPLCAISSTGIQFYLPRFFLKRTSLLLTVSIGTRAYKDLAYEHEKWSRRKRDFRKILNQEKNLIFAKKVPRTAVLEGSGCLTILGAPAADYGKIKRNRLIELLFANFPELNLGLKARNLTTLGDSAAGFRENERVIKNVIG